MDRIAIGFQIVILALFVFLALVGGGLSFARGMLSEGRAARAIWCGVGLSGLLVYTLAAYLWILG